MIRITVDDFKAIELPKWPQALITGPDVTVEQAKMIIFRTDKFFTDVTNSDVGNNYRWGQWALKRLGYASVSAIPYSDVRRELIAHDVRERNQFLDLNYMHTDWAASCFACGPHGFCSPEGKIRYVDNIGKWPSHDEIISDLEALAAAFPFLEFWMTLRDHVYDPATYEVVDRPVLATFHVKQGIIAGLYKGTLEPFDGFGDLVRVNADYKRNYNDPYEGQGLPHQWIADYGSVTKPIVEALLKEYGISKPILKSRNAREGEYCGVYEGRVIRGNTMIFRRPNAWLAEDNFKERASRIHFTVKNGAYGRPAT